MSHAALDRAQALRALQLSEQDISKIPPITPQLKQIARVMRKERNRWGGPEAPTTGANIDRMWDYYLMQSTDPDARKVWDEFDSLPRALARTLPIEAYCARTGVSPIRILEILTGTLVRLGMQAATIIAAVNQPRIVQKTVEMAMTDDGFSDRELLHKHSGFLPQPKAPQTNINLTQQNANLPQAAVVVPAPSPESTIRRVVDRFNDARALPADVGHTPVPEFAEPVAVEVLPAESEEEEGQRA